jgi:hypothetical protein
MRRRPRVCILDSRSQLSLGWSHAMAKRCDGRHGPAVVDDQVRGHAGTTILRPDLDHGLVRRPGDREDIEQDAVFLVLGIGLKADGIERQDLSALQQRAPARDQGGLRDVELLERVRIRSAADKSRQLGELAQPVEAT